MTTEKDIYEYIEWHKNKYNYGDNPIFEILLFEKIEEDEFGYPDVGCQDHPGFYYELDKAITAMNQNWSDIQDHAFHAGFILCHFPGMYQVTTPDSRMFFLWNKEKQGFFQAEEPKIFEYYAY